MYVAVNAQLIPFHNVYTVLYSTAHLQPSSIHFVILNVYCLYYVYWNWVPLSGFIRISLKTTSFDHAVSFNADIPECVGNTTCFRPLRIWYYRWACNRKLWNVDTVSELPRDWSETRHIQGTSSFSSIWQYFRCELEPCVSACGPGSNTPHTICAFYQCILSTNANLTIIPSPRILTITWKWCQITRLQTKKHGFFQIVAMSRSVSQVYGGTFWYNFHIQTSRRKQTEYAHSYDVICALLRLFRVVHVNRTLISPWLRMGVFGSFTPTDIGVNTDLHPMSWWKSEKSACIFQVRRVQYVMELFCYRGQVRNRISPYMYYLPRDCQQLAVVKGEASWVLCRTGWLPARLFTCCSCESPQFYKGNNNPIEVAVWNLVADDSVAGCPSYAPRHCVNAVAGFGEDALGCVMFILMDFEMVSFVY